MIRCPRCGRSVQDNDHGRTAHRQSCVRIPERRAKDWGKKVKK